MILQERTSQATFISTEVIYAMLQSSVQITTISHTLPAPNLVYYIWRLHLAGLSVKNFSENFFFY